MLLSQLRIFNLGLRGFQSASQVQGGVLPRDWYQKAHISARSSNLRASTMGVLAGSASLGQRSMRGPSAPAATPILADGQDAVPPEDIKEYVKYGELCQLTYDSFRNKKQAAKLLSTPRPGDKNEAADLLSTPRPGVSGFDQMIKEKNMAQLIELLQPKSAARGYQIVDFLYANSGWDFKDDKQKGIVGFVAQLLQESNGIKEKLDKLETLIQEQHNWIGFMAVGPPDKDGMQDVAIVFRGTITSTEWANNFDAFLEPAFPWIPKGAETPHGAAQHNKEGEKPAKLARGFKRTYASPSEEDPNNRTSPQFQVHETLMALQKDPKYKIGTITTTGHSLGGALATLAAYDLAQDSCRGHAKVRSITFAGPKVGDDNFVASFEKLDVDLTRIVNVSDIVPQVPGISDEVIKEILDALPNGAKPGAKPGDKDFRMRVIEAGKKAGVGVAALFEYMSKSELNPLTGKPYFGPLLGDFEHIGPAINLDSTKLPLVKQVADSGFKVASGCWHNLEGYLYMLDPSREACLINKGCDCLKPNSVHGKSVDPNWWGDGPGTDVPPKCPLEH